MEISVSIENGLKKKKYIYVIMLVHNELFGCACAGRSILYTPPTYYYSLTPVVTHYSFLMKSYYAVHWEYIIIHHISISSCALMDVEPLRCVDAHAEVYADNSIDNNSR